ncbi:MAG: hypothetical protein IMZ75_00660 [Actinobacteria bacterium]|nr:hypothetical protein [Actinomycetota bacterium]
MSGRTGSSLLNTVVKTVVHRLRPVLTHPVAREHGLSFPGVTPRPAWINRPDSSEAEAHK